MSWLILCSWRLESDVFCDDALLEMFPSEQRAKSSGVDLFEVLETTATTNPSGSAAKMLSVVKGSLPLELRCSIDDITRGGRFFVEYSSGIMQSLMHFSLAGGFARYLSLI